MVNLVILPGTNSNTRVVAVKKVEGSKVSSVYFPVFSFCRNSNRNIILLLDTAIPAFLIILGYSFFKDSRPSFLGGSLFPHEEEGELECAAVCDEFGEIGWIQTNELRVLEIDGIRIGEILRPYANSNQSSNTESNLSGNCCPACGIGVSLEDKECPSCGLRLID